MAIDDVNPTTLSMSNQCQELNVAIPQLEFRETDYLQRPTANDSAFDLLLKDRWGQSMAQGVMQYNIDRQSLQSRILSPHRFGFVAHLIQGRAPGKRRAPQEMMLLRMPFNQEKFNFTKIDPKEVLFKLRLLNSEQNLSLEASVIVNKNPIEYCSALMVPSLDRCLPQVGSVLFPDRLTSGNSISRF